MTAAQPEQAPAHRREPTPEEIDAFFASRFADVGALIEAWFALFGTEIRAVRPGVTEPDAASG